MRSHYWELLELILVEDVVMDSIVLIVQPYEDEAILLGDKIPQPHSEAL